MIRREPSAFRWPYQLLYEYYNVGEYTKLYELCEECITKFGNDNEENEHLMQMPAFYAGLVVSSVMKYDYLKAIIDYERLSQIDTLSHAGKAGLAMYIVPAYFATSKYKDVVDVCDEYIKNYEYVCSRPELKVLENCFFMDDVFTEENHCGMLFSQVRALLYLKEYDKARRLMETVNFSVITDTGISDKFVLDFITFLAKNEDESKIESCDVSILVGMIESLFENDITKNTLRQEIVDKLKGEKKCDLILDIMSQCNVDDVIVDFSKLKIASYDNKENNGIDNENMINNFIKLSKSIDWLTVADDVWKLLTIDQANAKKIVCANSLKDIIKATDYMVSNMNKGDIEDRISLIAESFEEMSDKRLDYMIFKANEAIMIQTPRGEWEDFEELNELLYAWSNGCTSFYAPYYTGDAYQGDMDLLPDNLKLAYCIRPIFEIGIEHYKEVLMLLKELVGIYEPMSDAISAYSSLYGKFVVDNI